MAESFGNFMASYGFYGIIIIIGVLICTQLTKWPIKKWAEGYALENNLDVENGKKIVTRWLMIVPYVYSFIFTFIYVLGHDFAWNVEAVNWFTVAQYTIAYATIAIAIFEAVKAFVTGNKEKTTSLGGTDTEAVQKRIEEKEAKKKAKEEAKAEKAKAKAQQKVLALQKELAELNSQAVKEVVGTNVVNN